MFDFWNAIYNLIYPADKETERDKLFEGATSDTQPRFRTPDEIKAKYRKAGVLHKITKYNTFFSLISCDLTW